MFTEFLEDNNYNIFLQKEDDNDNLRYALVLDKNKNGLVFGYEGGGLYGEMFIINGGIMPDVDIEGEELDWDKQVELFNNKTGSDGQKILDTLCQLGKVVDGGGIELQDKELIKSLEKGAITYGDITPIDYANTIFDPIKYKNIFEKFEDIDKMIKEFKKNQPDID